MRRSKMICTIGPACDDLAILKEMLSHMDIARLNFSHGTHDVHLRYIRKLRAAAKDLGKDPAILLDIKGPEIRLGNFGNEPVLLEKGQTIVLRGASDEQQTLEGYKNGGYLCLPMSYKELAKIVVAGNTILLADGLVSLTVKDVVGYDIFCLVDNGGKIYSGKGVNVPGVDIDVSSLTEKDREDILFGIEQGVDFIAVSFVRTAADMLNVKKVIKEAGGCQEVIAKIECSAAVVNMEEIIRESDGVMVARGDLGVEIPPEDVPVIQKEIIKECNELGKPVITATQMLESMINNPRPTRAEASDIANAILDGTDVVMLSGETAIGKFPVESVNTMARIARRADEAFRNECPMGRVINKSMHTTTDSIGRSTCTISYNLNASAIITSTQTGYTAKMVARYRPPAPIIAVTPNEAVARKLALVWGVQTLLVEETHDTDSMIDSAVKASLDGGMIKPGDLVILTAGVPVGVHGTTNLLKIETVKDLSL